MVLRMPRDVNDECVHDGMLWTSDPLLPMIMWQPRRMGGDQMERVVDGKGKLRGENGLAASIRLVNSDVGYDVHGQVHAWPPHKMGVG